MSDESDIQTTIEELPLTLVELMGENDVVVVSGFFNALKTEQRKFLEKHYSNLRGVSCGEAAFLDRRDLNLFQIAEIEIKIGQYLSEEEVFGGLQYYMTLFSDDAAGVNIILPKDRLDLLLEHPMDVYECKSGHIVVGPTKNGFLHSKYFELDLPDSERVTIFADAGIKESLGYANIGTSTVPYK